jgi:hypothetical protein
MGQTAMSTSELRRAFCQLSPREVVPLPVELRDGGPGVIVR